MELKKEKNSSQCFAIFKNWCFEINLSKKYRAIESFMHKKLCIWQKNWTNIKRVSKVSLSGV